MSAWAKMAVAVVLLVMPGGFLFLFGLALWRAYAEKVRQIRAENPGATLLSAMASVRVRDVWRETRNVTGLHAVVASGH